MAIIVKESRTEKITMLQNLQNGLCRNSELKVLCRECLPFMDDDIKAQLSRLINDPFATASQLYEVASDGILDIIIDWIKKDSRPSCKHEIIGGVNYCIPIHYVDEEEPTDWSGHIKELELMKKLSKFKPQ